MSSSAKNRTRSGGKAKVAAAIQEQTGLGRSQAFKLAGEVSDIAKVKDLTEAKLLKVKLECQRIAKQLEVDAGNWLHKDIVHEQTVKNVAVIKACLGSLIAVLPGQLEGLSAAQMAPIIEREVNNTLQAMAKA
jgi:hypothetical protein